MSAILEIVNNIERVSGITTFSDNFFKHPSLLGLKRNTVCSKPSVSLCRKVIASQSIYCHVLYSLDFIFIIFLCVVARKKLIIVSHGNLIIRDKSKFKKRIFISIISFLSKFGDVITQFLNKCEFERSVKITKNHFICPPFLMLNDSERKAKVTPGNKFLYMGANYYDRKGFDRMFQIFAALRKEGRECSLDLVGVVPTEEIDEAIRRYNLKGTVCYLDPIFGEEKFALMTKYDALVLFSRSEGWPMVVLEAVNVGLPVILSEETNVAETVVKFDVGVVISNYSSVEKFCALEHLEMRSLEMLLTHNASRGFEKIRKQFLSI